VCKDTVFIPNYLMIAQKKAIFRVFSTICAMIFNAEILKMYGNHKN